jgi:hypothetical protein
MMHRHHLAQPALTSWRRIRLENLANRAARSARRRKEAMP